MPTLLERQGVAGFQHYVTAPQVEALPSAVCRSATGSELRPACATACQAACETGLARYAADSKALTGYALDETPRGRVLRSCERQCVGECAKPGQSYGFASPYRQ